MKEKYKFNRNIIFLFSLLFLIFFIVQGVKNDFDSILGIKIISQNEYEDIISNKTEEQDLPVNLYFNGSEMPYADNLTSYLISQSADIAHYQGKISCNNSEFKLRVLNKDDLFNKNKFISENQTLDVLVYNSKTYKCVSITLSGLPVIYISETGSDETDMYGKISIFENSANKRTHVLNQKTYDCKYHTRGGSSSVSLKKSYKVNLLENGKKHSSELLGMRDDNDWILNPLYFDNSKMREKIGYDIWNNLSDINNHSLQYCELIINNEYAGLYCLQEPVDIKTYKKNSNTSYLYSIKQWETESHKQYLYKEDIDLNEYLDSNDMLIDEYSIDKYGDGGLDIATELLKTVDSKIKGTDFNSRYIVSYDADNQMNYSLFVNMIMAIDNTYKNQKFCISKYSTNEYVLTKSPWDLDWSMLNPNTLQYIYNKNAITHDRFILDSTRMSNNKLKHKYYRSREQFFNEKYINSLIDKYSELLTDSGSLLRESNRWNSIDIEQETKYLKEFFTQRIKVLDDYYGGL